MTSPGGERIRKEDLRTIGTTTDPIAEPMAAATLRAEDINGKSVVEGVLSREVGEGDVKGVDEGRAGVDAEGSCTSIPFQATGSVPPGLTYESRWMRIFIFRGTSHELPLP